MSFLHGDDDDEHYTGRKGTEGKKFKGGERGREEMRRLNNSTFGGRRSMNLQNIY